MKKKKNIILIQGRDTVGVTNELKMLLRAFRERQSDTNISLFRLEEIDNLRNVEQLLLSVGLFVEKRLFVFRGNFIDKKEAERDAFFLKILEHIDDETFIVFAPDDTISPGIGNWIERHGDIRNFEQVFNLEVWKKRFPEIDGGIIREVLSRYEQLYSLYEDRKKPRNMSSLIGESLEKLSLLSSEHTLTKNHIDASIHMGGSGKMFDFIDAILAENIKKSLEIFRGLTSDTTMYNFLPGFITLLRNSVYIRYLREKGMSEGEAAKIMKLHPFVAKKAYQSRISWEKLRDFYDKIVSVNIAYRSGKGLHDPELGRIFGIERAIIGLKK